MGFFELIGGVFMLSVPAFMVAETLESGTAPSEGPAEG